MHRSAMLSLADGAAFAALAANTDKGHAAPAIFEHDTFLFSPEAPAGRLFAAGDQHPGEGWADEPSVPVDLTMTLSGFAKDIIEPAFAGIDPEAIQTATDEAVAKALEEQAGQFDVAFEKVTKEKGELTKENDDLRGQIASLNEDLRQANAKAADLGAQVDLFGEETKKLQAKVDEQAAAIAKFDSDGDGKPGGSAPKAK